MRPATILPEASYRVLYTHSSILPLPIIYIPCPHRPCHPIYGTYGAPQMNIRSIMKITLFHTAASILRCQQRQSGGTECKENFQRPELPQTSSWWGGRLAGPSPTTPCCRFFGSLLLFPHSKIVPPLDSGWRRP